MLLFSLLSQKVKVCSGHAEDMNENIRLIFVYIAATHALRISDWINLDTCTGD